MTTTLHPGNVPRVQIEDDDILDAALDQISLVGLRATAIRDIARRTGLDRTTVYRRIGSKDEIVSRVTLREFVRMSETIRIGTEHIPGVRDRMSESFAQIVMALRTHPLLHQVLKVDAGEILPMLTVGGGPVLDLATDYVAGLITEARGAGEPSVADQQTAAIAVRLAHSLVLVPAAPPVLTTLEELREFAFTIVWRDL